MVQPGPHRVQGRPARSGVVWVGRQHPRSRPIVGHRVAERMDAERRTNPQRDGAGVGRAVVEHGDARRPAPAARHARRHTRQDHTLAILPQLRAVWTLLQHAWNDPKFKGPVDPRWKQNDAHRPGAELRTGPTRAGPAAAWVPGHHAGRCSGTTCASRSCATCRTASASAAATCCRATPTATTASKRYRN